MKMKRLLSSLMSCGLLATTYAANADVVIIANDSYVETYGYSEDAAAIDEGGFFDALNGTSYPEFVYGDAFSGTMVTEANTDESAYMDNEIWGPDSYSSMSVGMDMSASAYAETFTANAIANNYANSVFDITFTTDETNDFFFGAEIVDAFGSSSFYASLTNSMGETLFDLYLSDGFMSPGELVTGGADTYNLVVGMSAWNNLDTVPEYMDSNAWGLMYFEVVPTVVPVPAAVWLFGSGLVGLIGLARRKR